MLHTALLGMSFAAVMLYAAKLVYFTTDPTDQPLGNRLRSTAWAILSVAVLIGFSPPRITKLMGMPMVEPWGDLLRLFGLTLVVAAAIVWTAARGFLRGGTKKDVIQGALANVMLVVLSMVTAAALK